MRKTSDERLTEFDVMEQSILDMAAPIDPDTAGQNDIVSRTRFEPDDDRSLSMAVIEAVAAQEGIAPSQVDFQLYDWIEPEALDALSRHAREHTRAAWEIEFTVDEYQIVVRSAGEISIKQCDGG